MSDLLNRFRVFSKISDQVKKEIKFFHVFNDTKGQNVLFVTKDDKVFSFGSNEFGCCGLGHNNGFKEPQIIPELCNKNVQQFFIGRTFVLGLTNDKQVIGWGDNTCGQLGRGCVSGSDEYLKPEVIYFPSKGVMQLVCGSDHSLALSCDGRVFGWGGNKFGQIGCGIKNRKIISMPIHLKTFIQFSVKLLKSNNNSSYALTADGLVYSWGSNECNGLGHELDEKEFVFEPKLIANIPKMLFVCPSSRNTYFLTNERQIYFCGFSKDDKNMDSFQKTPKQLKTEIKFSSLHSVYGGIETVAVSGNTIYGLFGREITKFNNNSFFDFYSFKYEICYKTIHINPEKIFDGNDLNELNNYKVFKNMFEILEEIGSGQFGKVYRVKNKYDHTEFAIKVIEFKGKLIVLVDFFKIIIIFNFSDKSKYELTFILRGAQTLAKCSGDYVVQYFDHWIENNDCLYIQMELCSDNLKNIIQQKQQFFRKETSDPLEAIEYFISCQLFEEVLECVRYLHDSNIMHRDLKPENILVLKNGVNHKFFKLGGFGLAKFAGPTAASHSNVESYKYMAPEVKSGHRYNASCDVYSLGQIAIELFQFDVYK